METEERFIKIEIKLTSQEDLLQELNDLVYRQQKQIDELRALCTELVKQLGDAAGDGGEPYTGDQRPPHY